MDRETTQGLVSKEIEFPNGNRALVVKQPTGTLAAAIVKALNIRQPKALFLITGGAALMGTVTQSRLLDLFNNGIVRAAREMDAVCIDGGTEAGVMALLGRAIAEQGHTTPLIGIAPAGKVTYPGGPTEGSIDNGAALESNHSHFVLADSDEWGGETQTMFEVAQELATRIPVVAILVDGGQIAKDEVLRAVRHGWPLIVIEGSGRLADDLVAAVRSYTTPDDAQVAEIVRDGRITLLGVDQEPPTLLELLIELTKTR